MTLNTISWEETRERQRGRHHCIFALIYEQCDIAAAIRNLRADPSFFSRFYKEEWQKISRRKEKCVYSYTNTSIAT